MEKIILFNSIGLSRGFICKYKVLYHCRGIDPSIESVAGDAQVGLVKLVVLGPAERYVAQTLLYYTYIYVQFISILCITPRYIC